MKLSCAMVCVLVSITIAPNAAADFPWDEIDDVEWAGRQAVTAASETAIAYAKFTSDTTNQTYAQARSEGESAVPSAAPSVCGIESTFSCSLAVIIDTFNHDTTTRTFGFGDEARAQLVEVLVESTVGSCALTVAAYDAITGGPTP